MVGINIKTHFPHQVGMQQCGIEHDSHPTEWSNLNVQNLVNCPALTELNISEWSVETSRDAGKTENSEECFCCARASSLKIVHFSVSVGIYASFIWTLPVGSLLRKAKAKKKTDCNVKRTFIGFSSNTIKAAGLVELCLKPAPKISS